MRELSERTRRKPSARGRLVRLADGHEWLLAEPTFRPTPAGLTTPAVDLGLDSIYERIVQGDDIPLVEILSVAGSLLLANYDLDGSEVAELLEVGPGVEAESLAEVVLEALFGPDQKVRGYVDWVRASLLANGLSSVEVPASAIHDVLSILLATGRTVPPSQFVDACRAARDRDSLERLI